MKKRLPGRDDIKMVIETMTALQGAYDPLVLVSCMSRIAPYMFRLNRVYGKLGKRWVSTLDNRVRDRFRRFEHARYPVFDLYGALAERHATLCKYSVTVIARDGTLRTYGARA